MVVSERHGIQSNAAGLINLSIDGQAGDGSHSSDWMPDWFSTEEDLATMLQKRKEGIMQR